jgi:hypothetical protein
VAARRLLIVMVVLLVVSSIAAALVPPPTEQSDEEQLTTTEERTTGDRGRAGELVSAEVDAESDRTAPIAVDVGDQLALTVRADRFREVQIPSFGLLEPATAGSPAKFDILIERPGSFPVRLADAGRAIARIEARKPDRVSRSARSGESQARERGNRE